MTLLPSNATPLERAFAGMVTQLLLPEVPIATLWTPAAVPVAVLPYLAWALSVDDWDPLWPEDRQREVVAASVEIHRRKGTRWAVHRLLEVMGYGDAVITEDWQLPRIGDADFFLGDETTLGGDWVLGPDDPHWADYWVEIQTPISRRDADRLADRLASVAPVRCRLRSISLTGVFYTLGDDQWLIGDDVALGNVYIYEV